MKLFDYLEVVVVSTYLMFLIVICTILSVVPSWREDIRSVFCTDPYEMDSYLRGPADE